MQTDVECPEATAHVHCRNQSVPVVKSVQRRLFTRYSLRISAGYFDCFSCLPPLTSRKYRNRYWLKLSLYLINEALLPGDVWVSGGVTLPFLTSTLDGDELSASRPSLFNAGGNSTTDFRIIVSRKITRSHRSRSRSSHDLFHSV
jgi:hypothetical protein